MTKIPLGHLLVRRDSDTTDTALSGPSLSPIYIAGFAIAGIIIIGIIALVLYKIWRKRSMKRGDSQRGAAFVAIRGLVREDDEKNENSQAIQCSMFSRAQINSAIILPEKVIPRPPRVVDRDEIFNYHRQSGNIPRPFAPFHFALSASSSSPPCNRSSNLNPSPDNRSSVRSSIAIANRLSRFGRHSVSSSDSRYSVISADSSVSSLRTAGHERKVRQLFDPVLPDELLITAVGERLTIVQSFDDGWCLVGRRNGAFKLASNTNSAFTKPTAEAESDIELGVAPAWCFLKFVKGLRAERPIRSSSLGLTVQLGAPGFSSRDEVISWSNF